MSTVPATKPARQTSRKPAKAKSRSIRLEAKLPDKVAGAFSITEGNDRDAYFFCEFPTQWGRAFTVEKIQDSGLDPEAVYDVNVGGNGQPASCECLGWLRWGHKTVCRHVAGMKALIAAGKI
jgi:hypothetical protein